MASSTGHQSPQSSLPPLSAKVLNTREWLTTGNTDVVTDEYVHTNSMIMIMPTSAFAGRWYVTVAQGTFTVTSSNSETQTTTTYSYVVL